MTTTQKIYSLLKKALLLTLMVGCFAIGNITGSVYAAQMFGVNFNVSNINIVNESAHMFCEEGTDYVVQLQPYDGYTVDVNSISVQVAGHDNASFTFNSSTNQLTVSGSYIKAEIIINANAVDSTTIASVTAINNNGTVDSPQQVTIGEDYHATFAANSGYILYPTLYRLTVGGEDILENTAAYTFDRSTGEVTILGEYVTGDIYIAWNAQELVVKGSVDNGYITNAPDKITLGSELQFTIVPNEYYNVPQDYHMALYYGTSSGEVVPDEGFTYDTETGVVTIKAEYVTDVIYVSAACMIKQATITYTLTNATYEQYSSYPTDQTNYLATWYVYVKPETGYKISSENVVVKMNGEVLDSSYYTLASTGRLYFRSGTITGDLEIIVNASVDGCEIEYDLVGFVATADVDHTDFNVPMSWPNNTSGFTIWLDPLPGFTVPAYSDTTAYTIFIDGEEAPARTGYWGFTSAFKLTLNKGTTAASHIRIYAHAVPKEYTITLQSDSNGSLTMTSTTYNPTEEPVITNPIPSGSLDFGGWLIVSTDAESSWQVNEMYEWQPNSYGNIILQAQYFSEQYTITLDAGDHGTINGSNTIKYHEATTQLNFNNVVADNHYTISYFEVTSASGSWSVGDRISADGTINEGKSGNITVKAIYVPTQYTITVDAGVGGTLNGASEITYTYFDTTAPSISNPTANSGFTFTGWEITSADGNWSEGTYAWSTGKYGNITITAKYEAQSFTINVLAGDHGTLSGSTVITYHLNDSAITLPTVNAQQHYTFTGWKVTSGGGSWSVGDTFEYTSETYGNITITAQYEATKYIFSLNDGDMSSITTWYYEYTYFDEVGPTIADPIPHHDGIKFSHWEIIETSGSWVGGERYEWKTNSWGNVGLIAVFTPQPNRPYIVRHYLEKTTAGEFALDSYYTQTLYATAWDNITVTPLNITGFTFDEDNEKNVLQMIIEGDGNDVFRIYYTRDTYSISYDLTGLTVTEVSGYDPYSVKYGVQFYVILQPQDGYYVGKDNIQFKVNGQDADLSFDINSSTSKLYIASGVITGDLQIIASATSSALTVEYELTGLETYVAAEGAEQVDYTKATYLTQFQAKLQVTEDAKSEYKMFVSSEVEVYVSGEKLTLTTHYTCNQSNGTITIKPAYVTGNIKIVAKASPKVFTITIKGDTADTEVEYTILTDVTITAPEKPGYELVAFTFRKSTSNLKWQERVGGNRITDFHVGTGLSGSITLTPEYEVIDYTITLNAGEKGSVIPTSVTYTIEDTTAPTINPATPYDGYRFVKWEVSSATGNWELGDYEWSEGKYGNIVLTAVWDIHVYNITFATTSDGTISGSNSTYTVQTVTAPTMPTVTPKNGYEFDKWMVTANDGNWALAEFNWVGGKYGNITVTATYKMINYTITYRVGIHGRLESNSNTYTIATTTEPTIPTLHIDNGYTFTGWQVTSAEGSWSLGDYVWKANSYGNVELTANYTLNTYTMTFVAGDHGTIDKQSTTYTVETESAPAMPNVTSNKGYVFDKWVVTDTDGNWLKADYQWIKGNYGNLTITATYSAVPYTITVDKGTNGEISKTSISYTIDTNEIEMPVVTPQSGYNFTGWKITEVASGASWNLGTFTYAKGNSGDITITAMYEMATYTITYTIGSHGTLSNNKNTYNITVVDEPTLPTVTLDKGYKFTGWKVTSASANGSWSLGDYVWSANSYGDITVNAEYSLETYTITINEGAYGTVQTNTVEYTVENKSAPILPTVQVNKGYKFTGWQVTTTDGNWSSGNYEWSAGKYGNITITAAYEIDTYTITYVTDEHGHLSFTTATYTIATVDKPAMPEFTVDNGYRATNWTITYAADINWGSGEYVWVGGRTGNLTIKANYEIIPYTITLVAGDNGTIDKQTVSYNVENISAPVLPNVTANKGYEFTGWTVTTADGNWAVGEYNWTAGKYGNITLTAGYQIETFTITYVVGDKGELEFESNTYTVNTTTQPALPELTLADGYRFVNWTITFATPNSGWTSGEYVWVAGRQGDLTVTANYVLETYTITIDAGDFGEVESTSVTYTVENTSAPTLPTLNTQTGYNFTGWTITTASGNWSEGSYAWSTGKYGNITITAGYEIKTYTITYEIGEHGQLSNNKNTYTISTTAEPTLPTYTLENGYEFVGWKVTDVESDTNWTKGNYSWTPNSYGNVTVTAEYKIITYTINFVTSELGEISFTSTTYTVENASAPTLPTATPNKGYEFTGWQVTTADGNWNTGNYEWSAGKYGNITVTANYQIITYTITYVTDEHGHLSFASTEYNVNTVEKPAMPVFTVDNGYRATNWTITYAASSNWTAGEYTWVAGRIGDLTIKANYELEKYTITLVVGTLGTINTNTVEYTVENTNAPVLPNVTTSVGYKFTGWEITTAGGNWVAGDYSWSLGKYGNITLTAKYELITYTITYTTGEHGHLTFTSSTYTIETENKPAMPVFTVDNGYRATNWTITYTADESWGSGEYTWVAGRTGNITINANYTVETYTITLNAGANGTINSTTVTYNVENTTEPVLPQVTANKGYTFTKWQVTVASGNWAEGDYEWSAGKYGNITLTATYSINTYTITYTIGAKGSLSSYSNTYNINTTTEPTLPQVTLADGYVFSGWTITSVAGDGDWTTGAYTWKSGCTGNITVNADYSLQTYTITLVAGDNGTIDKQSVTYNVENSVAPVLPTVTTQKGYEFTGWQVTTADGNWAVGEYNWTEGKYGDITLTAGYQIETYTITYVVGNKGELEFETSTYNVTTENQPALPELTLADGYEFVNWTITLATPNSGWTAGEYTWVAGRIGDLTVTANYKATTYTITVNKGAHGEVSSTSVEYTIENTTAPTLPQVTPHNGYEFTTWTITTTGGNWNSGTYAWMSGKFGDITITANYKAIEYTITYTTGEHGHLTFTSSTYTIETADKPTMPEFTLDNGYKATNWTITQATNEVWGSGEYVWVAGRTGNITVNANYTTETYTITLNAGANGSVNSTAVTYNIENTTAPVLPNVTANKGYSFANWQITTASGNWTEGEYSWTAGKYGNITLTANYQLATYTITYTIGAKGSLSSYSNTYNVTTTTEPTLPTVTLNDGYTFTGWTITSVASDGDWTTGDYAWVAGRTGNITVNADYSLQTYTITLVAGDNGIIDKQTVTYTVENTEAPVLPNVIANDGYTFTGWQITTANGNWNVGNYEWTEGKFGNITLTARYQIETYTITYVVGDKGELEFTSNTYDVTTQNQPELPELTLADGYKFVNWTITFATPNSGWTAGEYTWVAGRKGDLTVTANYVLETYTITVNAGAHGDVTSTSVTYTVENVNAPTLPSLTVDSGYNFEGWTVTTIGGNWNTGAYVWEQGKFGNITITANYSAIEYTITYTTGEHGHLSFVTSTYTVETQNQPTLPVFTLDNGYRATNWTITHTANESWGSGEYIWESGRTGNITVNANYVLETYTITLNVGTNGTTSSTSVTYTVESEIEPVLPNVTPNIGYKFIGWGITDANGNWTLGQYAWEQGKFGNITITANYEIITYTITYVTDEHGHLSFDSVNYNVNTVEKPAMPEFTVDNGYKATNWTITYADNSNWTSGEYVWVAGRTGNFTVKANYIMETYTITIDSGEFGTCSSNSVTYNIENTEAPAIPSVTTQKGYEFTGWTVTTASGNWIEGDYEWSAGKFGNITITAGYEIETYTITYTIGAHGSLSSYTATYNITTVTEPTLPTVTLDNGYKFTGWTITFATPNSGWTSGEYAWVAGRTGDITINANYTVEGYTITIMEGDHGTVSTNTVAYTVDITSAPVLPTPTVDLGYRFVNWQVTIADGNWVEGDYEWRAGKYGNITITANYELITYTITYVTGTHGHLTFSSATYTVETTEKPAMPEFTVDNGYRATNWTITHAADESWGSGEYTWVAGRTGNITITANYEVIPYTITLNQGAHGSIDATSVNYNVENTSAPTLPTVITQDGYKFTGWNITSASGNWVTGNYAWEQGKYGDITMVATYELIVYTITYKVGEFGSLSHTSNTYTIETVVEPTLPTVTLDDGFTLVGWQVTQVEGVSNWSRGDYEWSAGKFGNIEITAKYNVQPFTITVNAGEFGSVATTTVVYEITNTTAPVLPSVTVETGYKFVDWQVTIADGNWVEGTYEWTEGKYGDITITANYELISYTITYVTDEHGHLSFATSNYTIQTTDKPTMPELTLDGGYKFESWSVTYAAPNSSWSLGEYEWIPNSYGNITVTASYSIETYTITLDAGTLGRIDLTEINYTVENANAPVLPTVTPNNGYEFVGWNITTASGNWTTGDYEWSAGKYGNITLVAEYDVIEYTITYTIGNDGSLSSTTNTYYVTTVNEPTLPTVTLGKGFEFTGWKVVFADRNSSWDLGTYNWQAGSYGNITVNAEYDIITYKVTINEGYHGTVDVTEMEYTVKSNVLNLPVPTPDAGYHFTKWLITKVDSDSSWVVGDYTWTSGNYGNITIYAEYAPNNDTPYQIVYYLETLDGGFEASDIYSKDLEGFTDEVKYMEQLEIPGFYYDDTNPDNVVSGTVSAVEKLVLKRYYLRYVFDVTFGVNNPLYGSVNATIITNVKYGTPVEVYKNQVTLGHQVVIATNTDWTVDTVYNFVNWAGANEQIVQSNLHITANFETGVRLYTIEFKHNNVVLQTLELEYNQVPVYTGETPIKEGGKKFIYKFDGWSVEGSDKLLTELPAAIENVTYVAHFDVEQIKTTSKMTIVIISLAGVGGLTIIGGAIWIFVKIRKKYNK